MNWATKKAFKMNGRPTAIASKEELLIERDSESTTWQACRFLAHEVCASSSVLCNSKQRNESNTDSQQVTEYCRLRISERKTHSSNIFLSEYNRKPPSSNPQICATKMCIQVYGGLLESRGVPPKPHKPKCPPASSSFNITRSSSTSISIRCGRIRGIVPRCSGHLGFLQGRYLAQSWPEHIQRG